MYPAIVDPELFRRVQQFIEENRVRNNIGAKTPSTYPFSKKIECGYCGKSFRRVVYKGTPKWQCATYLREGCDACSAKQIPEETLLSLASRVLGLESFNLDTFNTRILKVRVIASNAVRFVFRDGQEADIEWEDRSRRDSWTEEMRLHARERNIRKG